MTQRTIRKILRWSHFVFGLVIMCFIYSPFHENVTFQWVMKLLIIPYLTISGLWIWKFQAVNKFFGIKS